MKKLKINIKIAECFAVDVSYKERYTELILTLKNINTHGASYFS